MSYITFINVDTDTWNKLIEALLEDSWLVTYRYDNFDAGIDEDFVILKKDDDEIIFDWDNWFEGKIKFHKKYRSVIENSINYDFKIGKNDSIKPEVIELHKKWQTEKLT